MNANDIVNRVSQYDNNLAQEISRYLNSRKYGLVYEESKPEFVRLPNKTVVKGDLVNILPPRGIVEKKDENSQRKWRVTSVDKSNDVATLISLDKDQVTSTASYDDLVAIARFDQPIYTGLREIDKVEKGGDKPYNIVINGENFHALETLMYAYQGKIDCIYIDPPYNTGAKDWKYNNNYVGGDDSYRHSKWLTFMADRLKLAKKLLNPSDSVLICTIDEKEYNRLGILLEQIFPNARIQMVSDVINPKGVARNGFSRNDEYIYFVMFGNAEPAMLNLNSEWTTTAAIKKKTKFKPWTSMMRRGSNSTRRHSPGCYYPIYVDANNKIIKMIGEPLPKGQHKGRTIGDLEQILPIRSNGDEGCWQVSPDELKLRISQGRVRLGRKTSYGYVVNYIPNGAYKKIISHPGWIKGRANDNSLTIKTDINDANKRMASTQWKISSHNASENGSSLVNKILGEKRFTYPKSLYETTDAIRFFVQNKPEAIILDFFAGSGTTLHATNLLNSADGGRRQCICVTNNEVGSTLEKQFTKAKLRPGDKKWDKYGIAHYVTWPRVKSAILGKDVDGHPLQGNYGCDTAFYVPVTKEHKTLYKLVKKPSYPEFASINLADGFKENAVFFDLNYLEPSAVKADMAFDKIASLLWMKAGSRGRIIQYKSSYDITNEYAVLFDYRYIGEFTKNLKQHPEIKTIFIITDVNSRYQDLCHEFSGRNVYKLYESYLRSFEIQSLD